MARRSSGIAAETQPGLFGAPEPLHRLFFALLPDATARDAISAAFVRVAPELPDARVVAPRRHHLTLVYLGESAGAREDRVDAARRAAEALRARVFEVRLDRIVSFHGGRLQSACVLCSDDAQAPVHGFRRDLRDALLVEGLRESGHGVFVPHVTLAYATRRMETALAVPPVHWQARDFALLHSVAGRSEYEVLERWPLTA